MADNREPEYSWTNFDWGPSYGPWRFRILSEAEIEAQLPRDAYAQFDAVAKVASVTFQPCLNEEEASQDRRVVQSWDLSDGRWTLTGVFDGHAGHETADHAVVELPKLIKSKLEYLLLQNDRAPLERIPTLLEEAITTYDRSLLSDLSALFPGGLDGISRLSESEISNIINNGENISIAHRCMRGSTALISLVDPLGENLWVATLGDCQAVLGTKLPDDQWETTLITSNWHNGGNRLEADRIRAEHPGEDDCILNQRVLGAIAVTRALGDYVFKIPADISTRVFALAKPGFIFKSSRFEDWIGRNKTPPYLSCTPDVYHRRLLKGGNDEQRRDAFLIMCSDGLTDLYGPMIDRSISARWVQVVGELVDLGFEEENTAVGLLRDAMGGTNLERLSTYMTLENTEQWIDDTTIIVQIL